MPFIFSLLGLAALLASSSAQEPRGFGNSWGLQLRPVPAKAQAVWAPVIVRRAPTNESSAVARHDGTLEIYSITKPASDSVSVIRSRDDGLTWSTPEVAFSLPGRAYYALQVLESADGALHAVYHLAGEGPGGYRGKLYEVYHVARAVGAASWTAPLKVVPGYVGSLRGFIALKSTGRLVLAVARAIPSREAAPKSGPDFGWNDTFVYLSDDRGATWRQSPDVLSVELKTANVTRYGAIEPALLELKDGRIWMLGRDRGGRLWESFSSNGERWSVPSPAPFISSDSPASLLRLRDGRIVLFVNACQNWSNPRSYAMGGREVLHAAISADDGKTWRGFREVLHETDLESRGDRGTAYASAIENREGKVVFVSGQGEGKRAIVTFDPRWLEEREVHDDLASGLVAWTQYGGSGLAVVAADRPAVALPVRAESLSGALWNFPSAESGALRFRVHVPTGSAGFRICLTDHFNRVDDGLAAAHAVFAWGGDASAVPTDGRWHEVKLAWNETRQPGELQVTVDGQFARPVRAQRAAHFGLNYVRFEVPAGRDGGSVLVGELEVKLQ